MLSPNNNYDPVLDQEHYTGSVAENTDPLDNTAILTMTVTDGDVPGSDDIISYFTLSGDGAEYFYIETFGTYGVLRAKYVFVTTCDECRSTFCMCSYISICLCSKESFTHIDYFPLCFQLCSVSFNYEATPSFSELQVTVTDNGVVPRTSSPSSITVNIINVNDNEPVFTQDSFCKFTPSCSW